MADRDTHRGELRQDGTVVAQCGAAFQPMPYDHIALLGHPQDRDQICPECRHAR